MMPLTKSADAHQPRFAGTLMFRSFSTRRTNCRRGCNPGFSPSQQSIQCMEMDCRAPLGSHFPMSVTLGLLLLSAAYAQSADSRRFMERAAVLDQSEERPNYPVLLRNMGKELDLPIANTIVAALIDATTNYAHGDNAAARNVLTNTLGRELLLHGPLAQSFRRVQQLLPKNSAITGDVS